MIREALASIARNDALGGVIGRTPIARDVVKRVVGGDTPQEALAVATELADVGFTVSLERAAPSATSVPEAEAVAAEYVALVDGIAADGLSGVCEVALLPESVGSALDAEAAYARLQDVVAAAQARGVGVILGTGPGADSALALAWSTRLADDGLTVGVTVPAMLRGAEAECRRRSGQRIRLVKGELRGDPATCFTQPIEIDKSFVRCAKALLRGDGEPSFATHDPRIVEIVGSLAERYGRPVQTYEYAFFMGRQQGLQDRLLAQGDRVRVYVPYGPQWFERLVGGLAEQSSSIAGAVRSLLPGA